MTRDEQIRALWPESIPAHEIARRVGCHEATVWNVGKKLGLPPRPIPGMPPRETRGERDALIRALWPDLSLSVREIARRSGIVRTELYRIVKRLGLPPRESYATSPPPTSRSPLSAEEEAAAIARHIAEHGVTRSVDFGPHQAIVDAARQCCCVLVKLKPGPRQLAQWLLNGCGVNTRELYRRVNEELALRGKKPIAMPVEERAPA